MEAETGGGASRERGSEYWELVSTGPAGLLEVKGDFMVLIVGVEDS